MQNQKVLILNFGGQYDQLIARRVRECNVYCEVKPYTMTLSEIRAFDPIGIIFTGGPDSVYKENSYHPAEGTLEYRFLVSAIDVSSLPIILEEWLRQQKMKTPESMEKHLLSMIILVCCLTDWMRRVFHG